MRTVRIRHCQVPRVRSHARQRIREQHLGRWEGLALPAIEVDAPLEVAAWRRDPFAEVGGREARFLLMKRTGKFAEQLRGSELVVTHSNVICALLVLLRGLSSIEAARAVPEPGGLIEVSF